MHCLQNFSIQNTSIKLEQAMINIDEENVNLVQGIPHKTKALDEPINHTVETKENMSFIREMKEKYPKFPSTIALAEEIN